MKLYELSNQFADLFDSFEDIDNYTPEDGGYDEATMAANATYVYDPDDLTCDRDVVLSGERIAIYQNETQFDTPRTRSAWAEYAKIAPYFNSNYMDSSSTEVLTSFELKEGAFLVSGSWNVGGKDYTTKVTYNITTKELLEKILTTVQTVLKDENVAGLVSSMEGFDPASVEEALTSLREQDEAELPVLSAAEYSNEAGDTCAEILLAKDEQSISLLIASAGKVTTVNLAVFDQLAVNLVVDEEAGTLDLNGSFAYQGTALTFTGSVKKTSDDSGDFAFTVSVPAGETPISLGVKGTVSAEAPVFEAAEGAKIGALEDKMKDEEAATAFSNEVQMSAFGLLGSIMQQFPGLAVLMNPGTGTTAPVEDAAVEEAPAEEAPVVEEAPAAEEAPAN